MSDTGCGRHVGLSLCLPQAVGSLGYAQSCSQHRIDGGKMHRIWHAFSTHMARMWHAYGTARMWLVRGPYVACTCPADGARRWFLACMWHAYGTHVARMRHACGMHGMHVARVARAWPARGPAMARRWPGRWPGDGPAMVFCTHVACIWHACGTHVARMWHACGLYVARTGPAMARRWPGDGPSNRGTTTRVHPARAWFFA